MRIKKLGIVMLSGLVIISSSVILSGCAKQNAIYKNEKQIADDANSFSLVENRDNIDGQHFTATVGDMQGMDTIWTYNAEKDEKLDMTYMLTSHSGKVKVVLITPDHKVTTLVERTSEVNESSVCDVNVSKGTNTIKIVAANHCKFEADITIPVGKFEALGSWENKK